MSKSSDKIMDQEFTQPVPLFGMPDSGLGVLQGALGLISIFYPPAAPVIAIIEQAAPYIIAAKPLITAAIAEGPGAFAAAKAQAPELAKAISDLAAQAASLGKSFGATPEGHVENVARAIFGQRQLSFEDELSWMDKTTELSSKGIGG